MNTGFNIIVFKISLISEKNQRGVGKTPEERTRRNRAKEKRGSRKERETGAEGYHVLSCLARSLSMRDREPTRWQHNHIYL